MPPTTEPPTVCDTGTSTQPLQQGQGGTVTVTGDDNTVDNQKAGGSQTTFTPTGSMPSSVTLNLGGESGHHSNGAWRVNP